MNSYGLVNLIRCITGWVKPLAEWAKSSDIGLSLHAAKALANLDSDFGNRRYVDGVYLYYPQHRYT